MRLRAFVAPWGQACFWEAIPGMQSVFPLPNARERAWAAKPFFLDSFWGPELAEVQLGGVEEAPAEDFLEK